VWMDTAMFGNGLGLIHTIDHTSVGLAVFLCCYQHIAVTYSICSHMLHALLYTDATYQCCVNVFKKCQCPQLFRQLVLFVTVIVSNIRPL